MQTDCMGYRRAACAVLERLTSLEVGAAKRVIG